MTYICSSISSTYLCCTASVHIFLSSSRRHCRRRLQAPRFSLTACIRSRLAVTSVDTWLNSGSTWVSCWSCRETSSFRRRSERLNSCSIFCFSFCRSSVVSLKPRDLMTLTRKPQLADCKNKNNNKAQEHTPSIINICDFLLLNIKEGVQQQKQQLQHETASALVSSSARYKRLFRQRKLHCVF